MPVLPPLFALAVMSADSLEPGRARYEEPQLRAEVDSAPASARACSRARYPQTGWTRRSAGIEGISYATPPGFPRSGPYLWGSIFLGFGTGRYNHFHVHWAKRPEFGSNGHPVEERATKHDYSWCREAVDDREMLIVAYKVTWTDRHDHRKHRVYVARASWPVRPGVWLSFNGYVSSPAAQRELLAVFRTFRVDPWAPSGHVEFRFGSWVWHAANALRGVDSRQ